MALAQAELASAIERIARGENADPFATLGPHAAERGERVVMRTFQPAARAVDLVRDGGEAAMTRVHQAGLFAIEVDGERSAPYRLRITFHDGHVHEIDDPYRYGRVLGDVDLHLWNEGTHRRAYEKLGAHRIAHEGATGVHFAVWAPNARRVSVLGDFNGWDGRVHAMRLLGPSGVWEIFIPNLADGERYKFEIKTRQGGVVQKVDPFAQWFETPPRSASIVWTSGYAWRDAAWLEGRPRAGYWLHRPMSVYEVHLGSWRHGWNRPLTYLELADELVPYVRDLGFTHIELLPVLEHPFAGSWGYQVIGFFAPTSRFGTPDDFKAFIDACHRAEIGVILDWVPGHFPKDSHGLARFDGTALVEHEDPRQGEHQDWGTLIFNYGRHEVRNFLLNSALYWLGEFHLDGLRVDAVASMLYLDYSRRPGEWVPNAFGGRENLEAIEFLQQLNTLTHGQQPGSITVAEESTAWPAVSKPTWLGGLGFTYKWNMGWMHDMLEYMRRDPIYRRWAHNQITFSMLYAYTEQFILPFSHDEVVHGKGSLIDKMPGDAWQKAANLRALYGYMYGHPGKKLLFMGGEFGQWREWNHDRALDWHLLDHAPHAGIQRLVRDLNAVYCREPSLHELDHDPQGFQWIDCNDNENSVVSFLRRARDPNDVMIVVMNFTPVVRERYRVGVPAAGRYVEVLNSDAEVYGGSNVGNLGATDTEPVAAHGHAQSLALLLPPLACVMLKRA